jgi:hypothetical protein
MGKQRYGKPDANHLQVKRWYLELGCTVADTKDAGLGVPDLFVACVGVCDPVEVKSDEGTLRPSQQLFIQSWRGPAVAIVRTQEDVSDHVTRMRQRSRSAA